MDRLFLSCWLRRTGNSSAFDRERLFRQFAKMLELFPFSRLAGRGPEMRIYAIEHAEPPQFERDFPVFQDLAETLDGILAAAREFMHEDCACEIDAAWDLWQFDRDWQLAPAHVTLMCLGPQFDNEVGDHLRIDFGSDSRYLPDSEIEGSVRMSQSNLKSLIHLVHEIEMTLDLERRQLWSESGENPVDVILQALDPSRVD
jgi:hypothetical protein